MRTLFRAAAAACVLVCSIAGADAATFEMRRAINVAQWFTWPRFEAPPATGILWPPYKETPRPPSEAELSVLRRAGFDTIRLPVDPAPFIVFEGDRLEGVYQRLHAAIRRIRSAGLKVVVDLHPNSRHPTWGERAMIAPDSPAFAALKRVAETMARRLAAYSPQEVALELMNEPRLKCKGEDQQRWQRMAGELVAQARRGNPQLTLIVTGACISTPEGLMAMDARAFGDDNLIFTFHYYAPFTFTHQGAQFVPWPDKYLDEVPWPAGARPIEQPLQRLVARMESVRNLDEAARSKALLGARVNLERFYASGAGPETIAATFAAVRAWAERNGVAAKDVFIGEFGVWRQHNGLPGARAEDRARWIADVRKAAEAEGFSWAYFNYDGPFALIRDDQDRRPDPLLLQSLGLPGR